MKRMIRAIVAIAAGSLWAAVPPLSEEDRNSIASDIVVGEVVSVEQKLVDMGGVDGNHRHMNWVVEAKIDVLSISKSTHIKKAPCSIVVYYWKVARRPNGWSGSQGQNLHLRPNTQVKLYLTPSSDEVGYELVKPNGWEYASDDLLLSLEDSGDMLDLYDTYLE